MTGVGGSPAPKGVAFIPPPTPLLSDAVRVIDRMTAQLPPDAVGAIVSLSTKDGWNAAVVHRVGSRFAVVCWIGKHWGGGVTGAGAIRAVW